MLKGQETKSCCCCNHPSVEAVAFCGTCSTMQGCSGFFCKKCDDAVHKLFVAHRRTEPKCLDAKACRKHPGHSVEEAFCWETRTFHCCMCGLKNKIDSEAVPTAIDRLVKTLGEDCAQLKNDIRKLSGRKAVISSELNDPMNPINLEAQMREALNEIQACFSRLKALLEQREKAFMEYVESKFNARTEKLENELVEVSDAIEKGNEILESYKTMLSGPTGKDANLLKELLEMKNECEVISLIAKRCETLPIIQTETRIFFDGENDFRELVKSYGSITETTNIPPPQDFRVTKIDPATIELRWSPLETSHQVAYRVMNKKTDSPDEEWVESYTGTGTKCVCIGLQPSTSYAFKIFVIYDGMKSPYYNTCNGQTVNDYPNGPFLIDRLKLFPCKEGFPVFVPIPISFYRKYNNNNNHCVQIYLFSHFLRLYRKKNLFLTHK